MKLSKRYSGEIVMYDWRRMTPEQRNSTLLSRVSRLRPHHSPPHRYLPGKRRYSISAACYEHQPVIAASAERFDVFSERLLLAIKPTVETIYAWCVLADHYHVLVQSEDLKLLLHALALLHGRTSCEWNGEDQCRGRRVWCNYLDREIRNEKHFWSTCNYIHHNPVKHGYVERWQDWPWSSARDYLRDVGEMRAKELWREHHPDDCPEVVELPF